jgi:hypothetical protein
MDCLTENKISLGEAISILEQVKLELVMNAMSEEK